MVVRIAVMNTPAFALIALCLAQAPDGPDPVTLSPEGRQPRVAVGADGRIALVYGLGDTIRCRVSEDSGSTFGPESVVAHVDGLMLGRRRGPRVAWTESALVVTAIGKSGDLLAWRSADRGASWSESPLLVNDEPNAAREGLHDMIAAGGEVVYADWLDLRTGKTRLMGARSVDGGATWGPDVLIYDSPDGHICECCHPCLAYDSSTGVVSAMWRNWLGGNRDMYRAASADGGLGFGPASKLGAGTWPLDGCPMDGGDLTPGLSVWRRADRLYACDPDDPATEKPLGEGSQPVTAGGAIAWQNSGMIHYRGPGREADESIAPGGFPTLAADGPHHFLTWEGEGGGVRFLRR